MNIFFLFFVVGYVLLFISVMVILRRFKGKESSLFYQKRKPSIICKVPGSEVSEYGNVMAVAV